MEPEAAAAAEEGLIFMALVVNQKINKTLEGGNSTDKKAMILGMCMFWGVSEKEWNWRGKSRQNFLRSPYRRR